MLLCMIKSASLIAAELASPDVKLSSAIKTIAEKQRVDEAELSALVQEFEAMRRTPEKDAAAFPVHMATPERVDRFFQTQGATLLPKILRQNGLIFAGQADSQLLRFQKPSDVLARVEGLFPEELELARKNNRLWGSYALLGPFENWGTEQAAFLAVWNCMPHAAWLKPEQNPYRHELNSGFQWMNFGEKMGDPNERDFGYCVNEMNGFGFERTLEDSYKRKAVVHELAARVVPFLHQRFASYLAANQCRGIGPDDCVLILHLWSSLSPASSELAKAIQTLEPAVLRDAALPEMQGVFNPMAPDYGVGAARFEEVWRRIDFLRSKLISVIERPDAWPADALRLGIRQIMVLQALLQDPYASRFNYSDIPYRGKAINPWPILYASLTPREDSADKPSLMPWVWAARDAETIKRVRAAVMEELTLAEGKVACTVFKPWLASGMGAEFALSRLQRDEPYLPSCAPPDWGLMSAGETAEGSDLRARYMRLTTSTKSEFVRDLILDNFSRKGFDCAQKDADLRARCEAWRNDFLALIGSTPPRLREKLLSNLTQDGANCFDQQRRDSLPWQSALCSTWIHEPAVVHFALNNTGLKLDGSAQFTKITLSAPKTDRGAFRKQLSWLGSLSSGMPAGTEHKLKTYAASLRGKGKNVDSVVLWRHPGHSRALIELGMAGGDCERHFLLLSPQAAQEIAIPGRIWNGASLCHSEIVRVSDIDADGNLEVWWALDAWGASKYDKCLGDESDLERNVDCSATTQDARMGEISGDTLTYFVDSRSTRQPVPIGESWSARGRKYPLPLALAAEAERRKGCNKMLIGSILGDALNIEDWSKDGQAVLSLDCAEQLSRPGLARVALFHELPGQSNAEEAEFGFVAAELDLERKTVLRLFQTRLFEDATTRIRGGYLYLDKEDYLLAPGIHGFGVYLEITHSPGAAEGGSDDDLYLFAADGKQLRPVISGMPMYTWQILGDHEPCFRIGAEGCQIETRRTRIVPSRSSTNGWRDLDVMTSPNAASQADRRAVWRKTGTLRYQDRLYR